ncbi:MAG TPA: ABC transporter permease [Anaerolineae bacterium]|nr:ABC transporter permease [Anaerolineae bacterium]
MTKNPRESASIRVQKLTAFIGHGFALAWSYKLNFASRYLAALVSVLFFYLLDQLFRRASVSVVEGSSYFTFVLVGGAFLKYLDVATRSFAESLREEMLMGTLEPLLATATPTRLALLGPSAFMLIEGTLLVIAQLALGVLLGADLSRANWPSAIVVVVVSLASLLCWGILSAAFTLVFKRSDPITFLVGAIAYVFSGVFFPVAILPPFLQAVSYLLPFTYSLHALRGALLGGAALADLATDLLALLAFTAVLLPLALWAMGYAIRRLKRTGELAHY